MVNTKSTGNAARKAASKAHSTAVAASIQLQLRIIAVELRSALCAVTVSAHALREQNADIDSDVAVVLQKGAGAPLHAGLEKIDCLLEQLGGHGSTRVPANPECVH